jgi:murein DD-endopeptidase MepM/ murein hydrolase activator NlpD
LPPRVTLGLRLAGLALAASSALFAAAARADEPAPVASTFVFPVGDELDFKKPAPGEARGFNVTDPYLAVRKARKNRSHRVHYGTDFSARQEGLLVRSVAAGVVDVSDANARVKVSKAVRVKVPGKVVKGKKTYRTVTKRRTSWKWRSGWGNRVVIRHVLPDGQVVYSLYAHLAPRSVTVRAGDVVAAGQPIARVGRTGRATAPHLHLEIRTSHLEDSDEPLEADESEMEEPGDPGDRGETEIPHTVDPLAFLVDHVLKCEDLTPGSWEARYAVAAVKDGIMTTDHGKFDPEDDVTRSEFYAALVTAFRLSTPFTRRQFDSCVDALVDTGILDASARSGQDGRDRVERADALELVLRCLDRGLCHGQSMSRLAADQLARDFNTQFAGKDKAQDAEREAKRLAANETQARRKGRKTRVDAVKPVPILDPGFESLAQSTKKLSRAEACLLIASALRLGSSNLSALERAATRVAKTG